MTPPALQSGEIHLWQYDLNSPCDSSILSPDEQARAERLIIPEKRQRFSIGRAKLRQILSLYTGISPEKLVFEYGAQGKPILRGCEPLAFNLSHADDVALVAIALHPVGIDVERVKSLANRTQMAEIAFSSTEQIALENLPPEQKLQAFFQTWTRKEALMKGRGDGFKLARTFSVPVTAAPAGIVVDDWTIHDLHIQPDLIAAVAVQHPAIVLRTIHDII